MEKATPAYSFLLLIPAMWMSLLLNAQEMPEAGKVISSIQCINDTTHNYALYLPSGYYDDPEAEFPVIYAFDAAARGVTPVELYREAAEMFGYIIAGSNVSENGPWEPILKAAETMMKDVEARFRIDKARRYTTGFSGGARVATSLAVLYGTFEGVIGCGAGFSPNYPPYFDLETCYIGLIGNADFNYQEMMYLDDWLSKFNIDHYIYEFSGGHEWPTKEAITNAVTWLEFKAMKNELIWINYNLREEYYESHMELIRSLLSQGNYYSAFKEALRVKSFLGGIRKLDEIETILNDLKGREDVRKEAAEFRKILDEERGIYKTYMDAFAAYKKNYGDSMTPVASLSWWKDQVKIAQQKIENGNTYSERLSGSRMIDFMWRTAYQQYEAVLGTEYATVARNYLEIWAVIQPDAISPYFYLAKYYTGLGKFSKALSYLQMAIDKGLEDETLIENDTVLVKLVTMPEYQRIGARLGN